MTRRAFEAAPYPSAAALTLLIANWVDALVRPTHDFSFLVYMSGLALSLGALHGAAWLLGQRLLSYLPRKIALAFWIVATPASAVFLAYDLGVFLHLHDRYQKLALMVLGGCAAAAAVFAPLFALMQPKQGAPLGLVGDWSPRVRALLGAVLGVGAIAASSSDRFTAQGLYPDLHLVLRLCSMWLGMRALLVLDSLVPEARRVRVRGRGVLAAALFCALPWVFLNGSNPRALGAFPQRPWPAMTLYTARNLLDFDQDGHSSLLGGGDCAPFDPDVNPRAREIPGNGIDDNCMLGDAKPSRDKPEPVPVVSEQAPLDVVLITIDSLRPDHIGLYNPAYAANKRGTTPNLDAWAKQATVFRNAYTSGGWTSVALPSLMRGVYPRRLHWEYYFETNYFAMIRKPLMPKLRAGERVERTYPLAFDDPRPPLAQRLARRGMYTIAVLDDGYSEIFRRGTGAEIGFGTYYETDRHGRGKRGDPATIDLAVQALRTVPRTARFFLWVHMFGVHGPDEPHPGARTYEDTPVGRYDHEVASMDKELARLLTELDQRPNKPAVIITADHGEALDTWPRHHGLNLDEDEIRIPLIARVPGMRPGPVDGLVSLVDIFPTILAITKTPAPARMDGVDLMKAVRNDPSEASRILLTETWKFEIDGSKQYDYICARQGHEKIILDRMSYVTVTRDLDHPDDTFWLDYTLPSDAMSKALYGYLDETGGEPRTED